MTAVDDDRFPAGAMREHQEHEIAFTHQLSEVEHALAAEAEIFSFVFEEAGVNFDPLTCVAMRFVSECFDAQIDAVEVLAAFRGLGVLDRAVELANEMRLEGDLT